MRILFLLLFPLFLFSQSNSSVDTELVSHEKHRKEKVIVVGFFSVEKNANEAIKLLNNYYIYREKNSNGTRLYIINLNKKNIHKILKNIKKIVPDAYIKNIKLKVIKKKKKKVKQNQPLIKKSKHSKNRNNNIKYNSKKNTDVSYTNALNAYTARDFKTSYKIFSSIYLKKLSDPKFNFYYGRSAYETGHYEIALAAYERVEIEDETNIRNKLEMARTYFMLKMYKDAEYAFKTVLRNPNIPDNIRTSVELSLSKVSKVQQKSFTHASVSLDMIYDSNVNYGSIGDYQFGGRVLPKVDENDDFAAQAYINVTNIYDFGKTGGFAIKNAVSFYSKNYFDLDAYNIFYASYTPSLLYKESGYTAEMLFGMDIMRLGGKSFLSTTFWMPRLEYNHNNTLKSIAFIKYQNKEFKQAQHYSLDSKRLELDYGIQSILSPRSYTQGNITKISENRVRGTDIYVNFDEYKFYGIYANQFSSNYGFDFYLQSRIRDYRDFSSGFNSVRTDVGGLGNIGLTIKLSPTLRLKLKASYEYVDSNQNRFTYQKHTASAGIIKTY